MTPRIPRLTSDWIAVRELPTPHDGTVIRLDDPNKTHGTVITGIVEATGPGRMATRRGRLTGERIPVELRVGQTVYFEVEMGRARLPWDLDVRIMRETDVAGVVEEQWPAVGVLRTEVQGVPFYVSVDPGMLQDQCIAVTRDRDGNILDVVKVVNIGCHHDPC